jgi:hypothetical protein
MAGGWGCGVCMGNLRRRCDRCTSSRSTTSLARGRTTTMTVTVLAASKEIRDAMLASGMEHARRRAMTGWRLH